MKNIRIFPFFLSFVKKSFRTMATFNSFIWKLHPFRFTKVMKKKEQSPQPIVAYLKVSPYIKAWMNRKYGRIAKFPYVSQLHSMLYRHIVSNPDMKNLTEFSYSEHAFSFSRSDSFFSGMPKSVDKDLFVAIELPEKVYKGPHELTVSRYWQLSSSGAKVIRRMLMDEFMSDLFKFIDDCQTRARLSGEKTTKEQAIDDFITINGIDMSCRENLDRYTRREGKRIAEEIEQRRLMLEEQTGLQLCYT